MYFSGHHFCARKFWARHGCLIFQPADDLEKGAGTFNPATFLRSLGPDHGPPRNKTFAPLKADGRYGKIRTVSSATINFKVVIKPAPADIQKMWSRSRWMRSASTRASTTSASSKTIGNLPRWGAWGLGWEVSARFNGNHAVQTYFQQMGADWICSRSPSRSRMDWNCLAMFSQKKNSVFDVEWTKGVTYGQVHKEDERQFSTFNFSKSDPDMLRRHFTDYETQAKMLLSDNLPRPAYDATMKCSHLFNLLDARGAISVSERTGFIGRIRNLAKGVAEAVTTSKRSAV